MLRPATKRDVEAARRLGGSSRCARRLQDEAAPAPGTQGGACEGSSDDGQTNQVHDAAEVDADTDVGNEMNEKSEKIEKEETICTLCSMHSIELKGGPAGQTRKTKKGRP